MLIKKESVVIILSYLLISSVFVNTALYLFFNQLFAFRLVLPVSLITLIAMGSKVDKRLYLFLQFFFGYIVYTLLLTFIFPSYANGGDVFNFILLFLYVFTLILLLSEYKSEFKKVLANTSIVFIILYLCFAFYEIFTGKHLPASTLNEFEDIRTNMPSVVFTNPNDFCTALTLMTCYCFAYFKTRRTIVLLSILLLPILFVTFIAGARLNILLICLFLLFLSIRSIKGIFLLALASIVCLLNIYFFVDLGFDFDEYNFDDESTSIRLSLYQHALNSISKSGGIGFGVNTGEEYYQSINDPSLGGITDPHGYAFEILINSGVFFFLIYVITSSWIVLKLSAGRKYVIAIFYVVYFLVLFSSSSSIFQMVHYLFFCYMISEATEKNTQSK